MKTIKIVALILILCFAHTASRAQNDLKARMEFEKAEEAYSQERYEAALTHIDATEKLLGSYAPRIAHLKIITLDNLCDYYAADADPRLDELSKCVTAYMKHCEKYPEGVVMEKFKEVYALEEKVAAALRCAEWRKMPECAEGQKAYEQKDYAAAMEWYRKATDKGNGIAIGSIGYLYDYGYGVEKDYAEAMKWYLRSSGMGVPSAYIPMGWLHMNGQGVPADADKAMECFRSAVEKGSRTAMYGLGYCYYVKQDYASALEWLGKAADNGSFNAMNVLGHMYFAGRGVAQDNSQAIKCYLVSAEKGNVAAMYNVGYVYQNATKDYAKAMEWYMAAAEKENASAMNGIGSLYYNGQGVAKDYAAALDWFTKAAGKGSKASMGWLAKMYEEGNGVKKDKAKAAEWKQKADAK